MSGYIEPQSLQDFRNLKQLKVNIADISINEWKNAFASNPDLEELDYSASYKDGFMALLCHLPKLQRLGLPWIPRSLRESADFQQLLQLSGLTKLALRSVDNLNGILVELAKKMNLVELEIWMIIDG